ncbi:MAG: bifunctional DNA-formamidopyrimidine glycosylase/DNA-(apurinic or apyrimidinic site) lyase [Acidobacteria bacterium]|nr:bifunctional DNA-formamidopyrimidine glycosylase/DNA-(apurinic or apyrimidinic site) lyase [Acidobacteriota bacterium]
MPELPEVELVVRSLNALVKGKTITEALLLRAKLAPDTSAKETAQLVSNSEINFVRRRGKHILFDLSKGITLIVHLRMSGRFLILPVEIENPKFSHAVFYLQDETKLIFQDQRHFGFMRVVRTAELPDARELKKLAPEPFSEEFSVKYLKDVLTSSSKSLKEFLLDQTKICGLGNIYAAEAMFLARLNPKLRANNVSAVKAKRLHTFIIEVLNESIEFCSTLEVDPENIEGNYYGGSYENGWRVYDREDLPCVNCSTKIKRIKQAGRSSYYCPKCQRQ